MTCSSSSSPLSLHRWCRPWIDGSMVRFGPGRGEETKKTKGFGAVELREVNFRIRNAMAQNDLPTTSSVAARSFERVIAEATACIESYGTRVGDVSALQRRFEAICAELRTIQRRTEAAVDEADTEAESQAHVKALTDQRRQYEALQRAYKAAALSRKGFQKRRIEQARQELLDAPQGTAAERRKQWKTEADLVAASKGVTESLVRTKNMLAEELEHSGTQLAAIEVSQERLGKTRKEYDSQHGKLNAAQRLIKVIDWQNQSERYLMWAGLALFALTAAYIVWKRSVYFVPASLRPVAVFRYGYSMMMKMRERRVGDIGDDVADVLDLERVGVAPAAGDGGIHDRAEL